MRSNCAKKVSTDSGTPSLTASNSALARNEDSVRSNTANSEPEATGNRIFQSLLAVATFVCPPGSVRATDKELEKAREDVKSLDKIASAPFTEQRETIDNLLKDLGRKERHRRKEIAEKLLELNEQAPSLEMLSLIKRCWAQSENLAIALWEQARSYPPDLKCSAMIAAYRMSDRNDAIREHIESDLIVTLPHISNEHARILLDEASLVPLLSEEYDTVVAEVALKHAKRLPPGEERSAIILSGFFVAPEKSEIARRIEEFIGPPGTGKTLGSF